MSDDFNYKTIREKMKFTKDSARLVKKLLPYIKEQYPEVYTDLILRYSEHEDVFDNCELLYKDADDGN